MNVYAPIICKNCGNADQDLMIAETKDVGRRSHGRKDVKLIGWRCDKCGHVTPDPVRK